MAGSTQSQGGNPAISTTPISNESLQIIVNLRFATLEKRIEDLESEQHDFSEKILKGVEKITDRIEKMSEKLDLNVKTLEKEDRDLERRVTDKISEGIKDVNRTIEDKTISKKEVAVALSLLSIIITIGMTLLNKMIQ